MNSKALCFLASLLMAFLLKGAIGAPGVRLRRSSDDISESGPLETLMWKGSADEEPELNGVRLKRSPYGVRLRRSSDEEPDFSGVRLGRSSDDFSESGPLETLMWKGSADEEPELNGVRLRRSFDDISESGPLSTLMWKRFANEVSESSPLGTLMWKMSAKGNSPFRA